MILHHQLNTSPVRSSDAVPSQQRFEQQRRERLERMRKAAFAPAPKPLPIVIPEPTPPPPEPDFSEPVQPAAAVAPLPPVPVVEGAYLPGEDIPPAFTSAEIIKQVCLKHHIKVSEIVSDMRSEWIVSARHEAMYRIREERHLSWMQIAKLFNRDHTSVIHGCRKHKASLEAEARKATA